MFESPSPPGGRRRAGRRGLAVFLAFVVILGGTATAAVTYYKWCEGAAGPRRPVVVRVPRGASGSEIVSTLHDKGVIRCNLVSRFLLRRDGRGDRIRAGTYRLSTNMTLGEALTVLTRRPHAARTVRLTIPPGYRLTQIAERVHDDLGVPAPAVSRAGESGRFALPPYLPKGTKTVEGFLFPETYQVVRKTATAHSVIEMLLHQFRTEAGSLPWSNATALGVTPYQAVVVASMIEREAALDVERPKIAAVIYNRLRMGIALGIDATLLYDDPTPGDGTLSDSDLASDSPYNTRRHSGLPPTPIASPGLASLQAALSPAEVPFVYYVLCPKDGPGRHRFSVGYDEFLANKAECLG